VKAVILAGGYGTRLQPVVSDVPKPMAPMNDKPFLEILLTSVMRNGVTEVTLAVGHLHKAISDYFGNRFQGIPLRYAIENEPLGTGGAAWNAMSDFQDDEPVFIFNGDTLLELDLPGFMRGFERSHADVGIALKYVADASRYGRVVLDREKNRVKGFEEKGVSAPGFINAGVYLLRKRLFDRFGLSGKFSLEVDCFTERAADINFFPFFSDGYFIDIGIPEDYRKAVADLGAGS
jgi:D-glycero-alpha-D-manno-heptose 1-phosphate guanylyltransferase